MLKYKCTSLCKVMWLYGVSSECQDTDSGSFTHPHVVPNLYEFFCWTLKKIFQLFALPDSSNIFFVFSRRKKLIQVWNNLSKWWQKLQFWVNYPFKPILWLYCLGSYTVLYCSIVVLQWHKSILCHCLDRIKNELSGPYRSGNLSHHVIVESPFPPAHFFNNEGHHCVQK